MTLTAAETTSRTPQALDAAVGYLRGLQDRQGWWKGELETNVTMDAEDLLLREFLGIRGEQETAEAARWIRIQQRPDGTWATFRGGPGDLSTTVEAWVALRLAGDDPDAAHMRSAQRFVLAWGGVERSRVFTRIWLALFGLWSWDELPDMPPELVFLPRWCPLNVYDWACWARQTVVPLTVVATLRPARRLPFGIDELRSGAPAPPRARPFTWAGAFQRLDAVLHRYSRHPVRPLRRLAMRRAAEWVLARQEADGSWGGIQPPWVYSLLALHLLGYPLDHPAVRAGVTGLDRFLVREPTSDGWVRRLEACQSPVWDTCLAVTALLDAGAAPDDPAVTRASDWLLGEEVTVTGDWAVRRPALAPGGWAFEFDNDGYPDTDDTAEVVLALRRVAHTEPARLRAAVDRGVAWTVGMQSRDGGWGAFDADNTRALITKLPFCDFGAVIDPPSADVTAHVVEMLAAEGLAGSDACRRGVAWLLAAQCADGSWFGRWGANHVYGTGGVVPALVCAGVPEASPAIRGAVRWLERHQNPDGGWGEDIRSYADPAWVGRGTSTASQTAWALLALLAAGERSAAVERGVGWLVDTQLPDGSWDEPEFTGTGFPGAFYLRYHLYRMVFPISALGRYLALDRAATDGAGMRGAGMSTSRAVAAPVVCTPLRVERAAVGTRLGATEVCRTGLGPDRSTAAAARLASGGPRPVLVAGVAGALDPRLRPGDLVVADEVRRDGAAPVAVYGAAPLAAALRRLGLRVHVGPVFSSPVLVDGTRRAALAGTGALAVDMESAWLAGAAAGGPFAVVRAVVDTPDAPLARPGTPLRALVALRVLRRAAPALRDWPASTGPPTAAPADPPRPSRTDSVSSISVASIRSHPPDPRR